MGRSRGTGRPIPIIPSGVSDTDRSSSGSPDELRRRFQILERVAIFFTLPDNILHAIARRLAPASAAKGSVIVHQGDPGDTMFIVESGRCEVYVEESPGHTITIALMRPDDFFGEMALLTDATRKASVRASQVPPQNFEEAVLGAILHHPGGMMLLPGVLRAEQADLITVDLVNRAMGILVNAFRYIVFDLGVAFTDIVISVLDHSQRVLVLVTPELSSLKDVGELLNIFTNVLNIVPGRVILALNNKVPKSVVSKEDVVRTLKQELAVEIDFDGTKPDEAAVKGEILVLTDPKSAIARGVEVLAQMIAGTTGAGESKEKKGFKLGRR